MLTFLSSFFPILENTTAKFGTTSFAFIGAVCFIIALFPPFIQVYKTNQTYALSEKFLFFAAFSAIIFFGMGLTGYFKSKDPDGFCSFSTVVCFANGLSLLINTYIFKKKMLNLNAAKNSSLSEMDYYNQVILPNLNNPVVSSDSDVTSGVSKNSFEKVKKDEAILEAVAIEEKNEKA